MFKAANNYDIHDPDTGEVILECREPNLGFFTKMFRFTDYKRMTPFDVRISTPDGTEVLQVKRGWSLFLSKVDVIDAAGKRLGGFKQKFFSIGGEFEIRDANDNELLGGATLTSDSGTDYTVSQAPTEVPLGPWVATGVATAIVASFGRLRRSV